MKSKNTEKAASMVARKFVEKKLGMVFDRVRAYRLVLIQDPKQEEKTGNRIIFANLRLMGQTRHRFTLTLEKISGQWTVVTATFNSFFATGTVKRDSIRRLTIEPPKPRKTSVRKTRARKQASPRLTSPKPAKVIKKAKVTAPAASATMPETVIPRKKDGLVYAKVIKISEDKDLIVEHSLGKRMVFIEEGQPFYGEKDESVQTRVGMTPIRAGDTIAYRPDKTFAGNHVFVGLPEEKE